MRTFLLCILILAISFHCSSSKKSAMPDTKIVSQGSGLEKVYVESVIHDVLFQKPNQIKLIIRGQLPNPSYTLDIVDVNIDGNNIYLTPFAFYEDKDAVLQVLIPFQTEVVITLPQKGAYKIHLVGRASTLFKQLNV